MYNNACSTNIISTHMRIALMWQILRRQYTQYVHVLCVCVAAIFLFFFFFEKKTRCECVIYIFEAYAEQRQWEKIDEKKREDN